VLLGDHIHLILPLILVFTPDRQHRHHRQFHPGEIIKLDPASHTIYVIVSPCGNPTSHTNYTTLCKIKWVISISISIVVNGSFTRVFGDVYTFLFLMGAWKLFSCVKFVQLQCTCFRWKLLVVLIHLHPSAPLSACIDPLGHVFIASFENVLLTKGDKSLLLLQGI